VIVHGFGPQPVRPLGGAAVSVGPMVTAARAGLATASSITVTMAPVEIAASDGRNSLPSLEPVPMHLGS
jgi:hypothetical protein